MGGTPGATTLNLTFGGLSDSGGSGTARNVVPWAYMFNGVADTFAAGLVTYDANGFRPLSASEVATGLTAGANSNITSATNSLSGDLSVLSIQATPSVGGATISGAFTLTVTGGAIQHYNALTFQDTTVAFGSSTGYFHEGDNLTFSGTANITGSAGVVISQYSTANYRATFSAANSFTGGLYLNGRYTDTGSATAGVTFTANNQLGAAGQGIFLSGGQLNFTNTTTDDSLGTRPIKLDGPGVFTVATAGRTLTVPGTISGIGSLVVSGPGIVNLTNASANTYSGGTQLTAGVLQTSNANQLGAGPLFLSGGTLRAAGNLTFGGAGTPVSTTLTAATTLDTQANSVTFTSGLAGIGISTLTKTGTGTLTLAAAFPAFSGNLAITSGTLDLTGAISQASAISVATGSSLIVDNTAGYISNKIGDQAALTLAGGFGNYRPPTAATVGTAEQMGPLNVTAAGSVFSITGSSASPTVIHFSNLNLTAGSITLRGDNLGGTSGNYTRIYFDTAPVANGSIIPNVFFASTAGSGTGTIFAQWDSVLRVIQLVPIPVSGATIDNFAPTSTPLAADFTTNATATAKTGASIFKLTLDAGSGLTLTGGNAAASTNANTPDGTLSISSGLLSDLPKLACFKTIDSRRPRRTLSFGNSSATVTTTSDLALTTNVTLSGVAGLTKAGAGNLTLNGPYSVTGPLAISAGTLTFGTAATVGDLSGVGTLALGANSLTINQAGATTFSGALTGGTTITKAGAGTLKFAPSNTPTYSGGTLIATGTLQLGSVGAATAVFAGGGVGFGSAQPIRPARSTSMVFHRQPQSRPCRSSSAPGRATKSSIQTRRPFPP